AGAGACVGRKPRPARARVAGRRRRHGEWSRQGQRTPQREGQWGPGPRELDEAVGAAGVRDVAVVESGLRKRFELAAVVALGPAPDAAETQQAEAFVARARTPRLVAGRGWTP